MNPLESIAEQVERIARELMEVGSIRAGQIVVIGTSTSEVVGKRIGTSGAEDIAAQLYAGLKKVSDEFGFYLAFQCCEHLNRALVIEREAAVDYRLDEVSAVPVATAGGSMSAYAYRQLKDPCLVETIAAHAGIDIGETLIGMHLRRVAVPVRPSIQQIGHARVTMARTRPKLIGGERTVYSCN